MGLVLCYFLIPIPTQFVHIGTHSSGVLSNYTLRDLCVSVSHDMCLDLHVYAYVLLFVCIIELLEYLFTRHHNQILGLRAMLVGGGVPTRGTTRSLNAFW